MEQLESQLGAADVTLSDDVLDRIDEIVPPGTNLNATDAGWQNPALSPARAPAVDRERRTSVLPRLDGGRPTFDRSGPARARRRRPAATPWARRSRA